LLTNIIKLDKQVKIYPNPATDKVTIVNSYGQPFIIKIYDLGGKVVKVMNLASDKIQINVQDLSTGVYIIELSSEKKNMQEKLIIHR